MDDCIFCKIVNGEIPTKFIYQDENLVAFKDIKPIAPVHILIVPKKHISSFREVSEKDREFLGEALLLAKKLAEQEKIADKGYRIGINVGKAGGQLVFHLHIHLIGGWKGGVR